MKRPVKRPAKRCRSLPLILAIAGALWTLTVIYGLRSQRSKPAKTVQSECKSVLVTGAAGFIGFHVSRTIAREWNRTAVVGVDNFNTYYDPELKRARAFELHRLGVPVLHGDVCDVDLMRETIRERRVDCVVHLAAQPGVRYSVVDPHAYVTSNIDCFVALLDVLTEFKNIYLLFASSSSVYGPTASIPFSIRDDLDRPGNMYAMTKQANEALAALYCKTSDLLTLGTRFFTVYGPWGRPDMAVYKFALKIAEEGDVPLFHSEGSTLERDFTYVDDIVDGVMGALRYRPRRCGEILNFGRGHPENVGELIRLLEKELDKKAIIKRLPLPPTELLRTYADIKESTLKIGYRPTVPLEKGIQLFVKWFREYEAKKGSRQASNLPSPIDQYMDRLAKEKSKREEKTAEAALIKRNIKLKERLKKAKERFNNYALGNGISLPMLDKKDFIFYEGQESPKEDIMRLPFLKGKIEQLKSRCESVDQCVAFTSDGTLKKRVKAKEKWRSVADKTKGLYVADIDMCLADLHTCPQHSSCTSTGPGQFRCECHRNYWGPSCIPMLTGVHPPDDVEKEENRIDKIDGIDWMSIKKKSTFVFFPGFDSPGGDYMVAKHLAGRTDELKEACMNTRRCLGFNTNGILKSSLQWSSRWIRWTDYPLHGLHVLDVNYCDMDEMDCPERARCQRYGPANYSCVCQSEFKMTRADLKDECRFPGEASALPSKISSEGASDDFVHIILSSDAHHLRGLATVIVSVLQNTATSDNVRFHIASHGESVESVRGFLACSGISAQHLRQIDVQLLDESWLVEQIVVHSDPKVVGNLASKANFARFYFDRLFPGLQKALYVDVDVIVQKDVNRVWSAIKEMKSIIAAVKRTSPTYGMLFRKPVQDLFSRRYGYSFGTSDPTYNAGVYAVDLVRWRNEKVVDEVHFWMKQNREHSLWAFGTQPLMFLSLHKKWEELPADWNLAGLGYNTDVLKEHLDGAALLHWNGRRKPWLPDGLYKERWHPFDTACSGQGTCSKEGESQQWKCACAPGFTGTQCNVRTS